jgi:CRAL/TRIO domain
MRGGLTDQLKTSDRVGCDVNDLNLTAEQLTMIDEAYNSNSVQTSELKQRAVASGWEVNKHLIFRYFAASGWVNNYNGMTVEQAVVDTINWRDAFIRRIDLSSIESVVRKGLAYVNGVDRHGRSLLYFKFGKMTGSEDAAALLQALMYTVERADRLSVQSLSGEFIAIIDFEGVSLSHCPPLSVIKAAIGLLKLHYPYRLGGIYVTNAGFGFSMLWKIIRPLLPKLALQKTHIVSKKDYSRLLCSDMGEDCVEELYGGKRLPIADFSGYLHSKTL